MAEPPIVSKKKPENTEKSKPISNIPKRLPMENITNKSKNLNGNKISGFSNEANRKDNFANKSKNLIEDNISKFHKETNNSDNISKKPRSLIEDKISKFPNEANPIGNITNKPKNSIEVKPVIRLSPAQNCSFVIW